MSDERLAEETARRFKTRFGLPPRWTVAAPGRVNLIGEHVDYQDGLVLPIAIDRATYAASGPGRDGRTRIYSAAIDESVEFNTADLRPSHDKAWHKYVKGVAAGLMRAGVEIPALNIYLDGNLPLGAGLSSSAALEIAVALSLLHAAGAEMAEPKLAALCRTADHEYVGVPCGIMDQTVCLMGRENHALLIDCRDVAVEYIRWPNDDVAILVADCGQSHQMVESPYLTRVEECIRAVECIQRAHPQVKTLRDASVQQLDDCRSAMPPELFRRARHVVAEIARTRQAARSLGEGDFAALGRLMKESHESLAADYEVSSPQLDGLADALRNMPGVFGARMTGGGFGGSVVALARRSAISNIETSLRTWYDREGIAAAPLIVTSPSPGATLTTNPTE